MGVDIQHAPGLRLSPFDPATIRKSVEDLVATMPPDAKGALVAVATMDGVKVAVAHKFNQDWKMVVQADVTYHGEVDGQVKLIGSWK